MYSGTCIPGNGDRVAILVMAHTISSGMASLHQKDGRNVISRKHSAGGVQIFHSGSQSLVLRNGFKKRVNETTSDEVHHAIWSLQIHSPRFGESLQ